jgi:hypothetical protein
MRTLTILSFALAAGLAACASPTDPGAAPSVDPLPLQLPVHLPAAPVAASITPTRISGPLVHPVCPTWNWPRNRFDSLATGLPICAATPSAKR